MRTRGSKTAALAAAAAGLLMSAAAANAVSLTVGNGTAAAGGSADIGVTLQSMGSSVAGTQNDLQFPTSGTGSIGVRAGSNGRPMCAVNPDIMKEATAFSYQPPQCAVGTTCTGVRALVLSLSNVDPIPDGSTLYTCPFVAPSDATAGDFELNITGVGASDPDGVALDATGVAGTFTVESGPAPVTIVVGNASGPAGGNASVNVSMNSGLSVAGTQNDIAFEPGAAIRASSAGRPLCSVNPAINKEATAFSFQPPQCAVGTTCTAIRALVLSLSNVDAIPDGSTLYQCDLAIAADATGDLPLTCSGAGSSDPDGVALDTDCTNGTVSVSTEPTATPTEAVTPPTATPTHTVPPPPTNTRTPGTGGDVDDGCAITAPAQSNAGWLLIFPAATLLWLRRRSR